MCERNQEVTLHTVAGAVCDIMGVTPPEHAAEGNKALKAYAESVFGEEKADRVLLYHPDAIPRWIMEKYPALFAKTINRTEFSLPLYTPMQPVTPVCFATIYTGALPDVHGIHVYERPVLRTDTIYDTLAHSGKKAAIIAHKTCTFAKIFLERDIDYYFFSTMEEIRAKTADLIIEDKYDLISVHDCSFDTIMHRHGPESIEALSEAKIHNDTYAMLDALVNTHWQEHNVLMAFAMDHGCHEIEGGKGEHGDDIPEDRCITHYYKAYGRR